jgi:hypothetical protein
MNSSGGGGEEIADRHEMNFFFFGQEKFPPSSSALAARICVIECSMKQLQKGGGEAEGNFYINWISLKFSFHFHSINCGRPHVPFMLSEEIESC